MIRKENIMTCLVVKLAKTVQALVKQISIQTNCSGRCFKDRDWMNFLGMRLRKIQVADRAEPMLIQWIIYFRE